MTQAQATTPVMPADLPPDTWIPYEAFSFLLPTMTKFAWEAGGKAGRLPAGKRLTPKTPIAYRAGDIAKFFADCAAEVAR